MVWWRCQWSAQMVSERRALSVLRCQMETRSTSKCLMVSGLVTYSNGSARLFNHQFTLVYDGGSDKFFIMQECFRLLE